mmetsp:Transcript_10105/g.16158  ORF Transcript_10105/g.16158 Transcript_10105/m.16158 type:complete len:208 (-) Transcript_10105:153-776(-)
MLSAAWLDEARLTSLARLAMVVGEPVVLLPAFHWRCRRRSLWPWLCLFPILAFHHSWRGGLHREPLGREPLMRQLHVDLFVVGPVEETVRISIPFFLALVVDGVYSLHPYLVHRLQEVPHFRLGGGGHRDEGDHVEPLRQPLRIGRHEPERNIGEIDSPPRLHQRLPKRRPRHPSCALYPPPCADADAGPSKAVTIFCDSSQSSGDW